MSILFLSGFESSDLTDVSSSINVQVQGTTLHTGSYALQCSQLSNTTGYATLLTSPGSAVYLRFYFLASLLPAVGDEPIAVLPLSSYNLHIRVNSSGKLAVYYSNTLQAVGKSVLSPNGWYRIEMSYLTSTGVWKLYIDGNQELTGTTAGGQVISSVVLGKYSNANGNSVNFYYDDVVIRDDQLPGRGHIECLLPRANGSYSQWKNENSVIGSYSDVNQLPYDTATNINNLDAVAGNSSTFLFTSLNGSPTSINSLKWEAIAEEFGGGPEIAARFVSGTSHADSAMVIPPASWAPVVFYYPTNPITALPWTTSDISTVETGVVGNASARGYVTSIYLMVDYAGPEVYNYTASGGVQAAGTTSASVSITSQASGGAVLSGSALIGFSFFGAGGIVVSGSLTPQLTSNAISHVSGVVCGGYTHPLFAINRSIQPIQLGPITVSGGNITQTPPKWKRVPAQDSQSIYGYAPAVTAINNRL